MIKRYEDVGARGVGFHSNGDHYIYTTSKEENYAYDFYTYGSTLLFQLVKIRTFGNRAKDICLRNNNYYYIRKDNYLYHIIANGRTLLRSSLTNEINNLFQYIAVNPNETLLVFVLDGRNLASMDPYTKDIVNYVHDEPKGHKIRHIDFNSSGTHLVFELFDGNQSDIYTFNLTTKELINITNTPIINESLPKWEEFNLLK